MSVTEDIKARLDIVNYIQQYVPLKKAGRYFKACCPFHSEKTPSFVVNPDTQTWRCFGACAEGGDVFSFAQKQHGWSFPEALRELGNQVGVEVRKQSPIERQKSERRDRLRGVLQTAAEIYHGWLVESGSEQARATLDYARERRGFTDETINQYLIGFARPGWQNMFDELTALGYKEDDLLDVGLAVKNEDSGRVYDRFRNRLMIPIRDQRGRVVGFGARALAPDDNPKYLNSPQTLVFDKSRVLFGLDVAKKAIRDSGTVVIVEGYMDVIQAHQAGFTNVVAQMGTAMTESQLHLVAPRYAQTIILALDSDSAGQSATRRSLETARQALESDFAGRLSVDIGILQIPDAKDPDDLIREDPDQWQELVENALSIADFVITMETQDLPSGADARNVPVQERMRVARQLLPILAASESNLYVESNIQKLAQRLYLNERELFGWAKSHRAEQRKKTPPRGRPSEPRSPDDEPPPVDYDAVAPPDFDDDTVFLPDVDSVGRIQEQPSSAQQAAARAGHENASEAYCLRMLVMHPDAYFHINRKFRELAGEDTQLRQGPLSGLGIGDFSRSDYRRLMDTFIEAVNQSEMGVYDFLSENLDPILQRELAALLLEEGKVVHGRLGHRLTGDLATEWKNYEQRVQPGVNPNNEALQKALRLRLERLKQELDEYSFLLMEVQQQDDGAALDIVSSVLLSQRAIHRLDVEVQRQIDRFL